jgi:hypothetical protein
MIIDFLLRNALQTPDGTVIESKHRHDFQTHVDSVSGLEYMIDGGLDYSRRTNHADQVDLSVVLPYNTEEWPKHEILREVAQWGTYGPKGDMPKTYVSVRDMDTVHIQNVIANCPGMFAQMRQIMVTELEHRNEKRPKGI